MMKESELVEFGDRLAQKGYLQGRESLAVRNGDTAMMYRVAGIDGESRIERLPIDRVRAERRSGDPGTGPLCDFYRNVFRAHPRIRVIMASHSPYARACADRGRALRPHLDDAAQLFGPRLTVVRGSLHPRLAKKPVVLRPGLGALCFASDLYELEALAIACEKLAYAEVATLILGSSRPIPWHEALLMRLVYVASYGKRAGKRDIAGGLPS